MVDSASTDGSVSLVRKKFPGVKIIRLKENVGVAGYNQGFRQARGVYFIVCDCDVTIGSEVASLVTTIFTECNADILAFKITDFTTGEIIDNPSHSIETDTKGGYQAANFNGSAWAMRRRVFRKIGGYNPEYFIYLAEMELSARALMKNYKLRYFPDLVCRHNINKAVVRNKGKYFVARNWVYFIVKYLPLWSIPLIGVWSLSKVFYDTSRGYGMAGSYLAGFVDGLKKALYYFRNRTTFTFKETVKFVKGNFNVGGFTNQW